MRLIDADAFKEYITEACEDLAPLFNDNGKVAKMVTKSFCKDIDEQPTISDEPQWIPCSERLPEEDIEVLISYRYKEGEGYTNRTYIDITTYGQMYFGGNKVDNYKNWRAPFDYFQSNYEVVAWMPLPEPWKGDLDETD